MGNQGKMERNSKVCVEFKTMKSTVFMICNFVLFYFPKQKICAKRCGRIKLERLL